MDGTEPWIHPSSIIDDGSLIGNGTKIWHYSHIMDNVSIGQNCTLGQNIMIGSGVTIGSGCKIQNNVSIFSGDILEENVFCGPSSVFTNVLYPRAEIDRRDEFKETFVRTGVSIGANATILCGITIGEYAMIGSGAVVTKNIPHDENKINEMLKIFLLHYTHNIDDDSVLFENVETVLKLIKSKKLKLAVCTNKMEKLSNMLLEKLGVLHYFDYLVGGDTFAKSKPDPFPLIEICKKLSVSENESIMIGDSATDLNAGHNANMPVVLVGYGYTDNKNIYNDADLVINNFSQLTELIE